MSWEVVLALGVLAAAVFGTFLVHGYLQAKHRAAAAATAQAAQARAESAGARVAVERAGELERAGSMSSQEVLDELRARRR